MCKNNNARVILGSLIPSITLTPGINYTKNRKVSNYGFIFNSQNGTSNEMVECLKLIFWELRCYEPIGCYPRVLAKAAFTAYHSPDNGFALF